MAAPRRKGKKPSKFFLIAAEMRPKVFRADQFFLHAEMVAGVLRLDAEDAFLAKMRSLYPDHTVGMMTLTELAKSQEEEIIDNASRRRTTDLKTARMSANGEAVL